MRIFLADGDREERLALQFLLAHEPGMEVVGLSIHSEDLVAQVKASQSDILLLDWNLVTEPAADCISKLHSLVPGLKIVALHIHSEMKKVVESAGADLFIGKDAPPDELVNTLRAMRQDELANLQ